MGIVLKIVGDFSTAKMSEKRPKISRTRSSRPLRAQKKLSKKQPSYVMMPSLVKAHRPQKWSTTAKVKAPAAAECAAGADYAACAGH